MGAIMDDLTIIERIQNLKMDSALCKQSIKNLDSSEALQWKVLEKIKESLSTIKAQLAAFGVINTLVLGWIAFKLTKGL